MLNLSFALKSQDKCYQSSTLWLRGLQNRFSSRGNVKLLSLIKLGGSGCMLNQETLKFKSFEKFEMARNASKTANGNVIFNYLNKDLQQHSAFEQNF